MKVLYFDCFSGISGDMAVAALLDSGVDTDIFLDKINKISISDEFELQINKMVKNGISGTDFNVTVKPCSDIHIHHHGRSLAQIINIINSSDISSKAKELAIDIFKEIALAESVVHGKSPDEVYFHEVGAVDSIVDIVGFAICADMLGIDKVICSQVNDGTGFVECQHGMIPVPVPAVAQMLKSSDIRINQLSDVNTELVTPTGFAILKKTACKSQKIPDMKINSVGYGFGKRETGRLNALRVFIGEIINNDNTVLIETNLDDCTAEVLGYAFDMLKTLNVLDVWFTPVYMKKNRPGYILSVLCDQDDIEDVCYCIFKNTSSIGVRIIETHREKMDRYFERINTKYGEINIKRSEYKDIIKKKPEFDSCAAVAKEYNVSLSEVFDEIKGRDV